MSKVAKKPRKARAYKMPDPLPAGEILKDITDKKWKLGVSIGKGGFGEIYCAQRDDDKKSKEFPYVIKIEPHENGPLFVERACYMHIAKSEDVDAYKSKKNLAHLGMPIYLGSGSHEHNGQKYRFLVLERFGADILKLFLDNNKVFPEDTVFKIGIQILDVLEYIHSKGYVHADVKAANILLDKTKSQVYLIDFGISSHYAKTEKFKPDPKKAHNGTIEYLSRDAHLGVQSRRGDLETLLYNLIYWFTGTLPWEDLSDNNEVHKMKDNHFKDLQAFLSSCFGDDQPPDALVDFLNYITKLEFDQDPDYAEMREILVRGLKTAGGAINSPLELKSKPKAAKKLTPVEGEKGAKRTAKDKAEETVPAKKTRKPVKKAEEKPSDDMPQENEDVDVIAPTPEKPKPKGRAIKKVATPQPKSKGRGNKKVAKPVDDEEQLEEPKLEENGTFKKPKENKLAAEPVNEEEQLQEPQVEENDNLKAGIEKKKIEPVSKEELLVEPLVEEKVSPKRGRGKKRIPEPVDDNEQLDQPQVEENGGGKRGRGKKKVPELVIEDEQLDEPKIEENGGIKKSRGKKKINVEAENGQISQNDAVLTPVDRNPAGRRLRNQKKVDYTDVPDSEAKPRGPKRKHVVNAVNEASTKQSKDEGSGDAEPEVYNSEMLKMMEKKEMLKKGGAKRNAKKVIFDESEDEAISSKPTTTKRGQKSKK